LPPNDDGDTGAWRCARAQSETDVSGASIPHGALGFTRRSLLRRFLTSTIRRSQKFSTPPSAPEPDPQEERSQFALGSAADSGINCGGYRWILPPPHPDDQEIGDQADDRGE